VFGPTCWDCERAKRHGSAVFASAEGLQSGIMSAPSQSKRGCMPLGIRRACALLLMTLMAMALACSDRKESNFSPTATTPPTAAPAPTAPTVVRIALTGNVSFSTIGETSQLTVTATYSDNTTKDVTRDCQWTVGDSRVATITGDGMLTVVGLGRTYVSVLYLNRSALAPVTANGPGTFVISGRVREPGLSGLVDATITETSSGRSTTSNRNGLFSIANVPAAQAHLTVTKIGYEPRELDATATTEVDAPVQRVIRLTAGESVDPPALAPNDLSYEVGGSKCQPCRLIRIVVPRAGDVEVTVTWQSATRLSLFAEGTTFPSDGGRVSGVIAVSSARELVVYVGLFERAGALGHLALKIATVLR
jgi:carboxypeptidase family protein/Big-like domain-containing protein